MSQHHYAIQLNWTGNKGQGTAAYRAYDRNYVISHPGKPDVYGSADPAFRGDPARYNPEEMLVAALSSCHMLWYLHLCADAGVVVVSYSDSASGLMTETSDGSGRFEQVMLRPQVVVLRNDMKEKAHALHEPANRMCFIANSCNFPVSHEVTVTSQDV